MKKAVLFDLDGTLLPMDQDKFTHAYFSLLAKKLAPYGYEERSLIDGIWDGTRAMVKNDGSRTNEEAFWRRFSELFGDSSADLPLFEAFYREDFNGAKSACGFTPHAARIVSALKGREQAAVLASNPIFPLVAQENRMRWAGLDPRDFCYITSYENSSFCKPHPLYYEEILKKLGLAAEDCLMVGNDAREDLAAAEVGMEVFLLTPCLINRDGRDISALPHGGYEDLEQFLEI